MGIFPLDFKKLLVIAALISVPLIAINIQRKEEVLAFVFKPFFISAAFVQSCYTNFSTSVQNTTSLYLNLVDIKKNNRELLEKLNEIQASISQFQEIKGENERLAALLEFKKQSPHHLVSAKVIGHDVLGQHSTLFIDKGSLSGIQPGQAVITTSGVVGSILNVESEFSQVLNLTDRYSDIDAVVERTRARGILEGESPSLTVLKYLQRTDDVQEGDLIVTTGLDHIFPRGFPLGKVVRVEKKDYGITQDVQVAPFVSINNVDAVFVVVKTNDKVELQEKMKELSLKD